MSAGAQQPDPQQVAQPAALAPPAPVAPAPIDPVPDLLNAIQQCAQAVATSVGSNPEGCWRLGQAALAMAQAITTLNPPAPAPPSPAPAPTTGPPMGAQ